MIEQICEDTLSLVARTRVVGESAAFQEFHWELQHKKPQTCMKRRCATQWLRWEKHDEP